MILGLIAASGIVAASPARSARRAANSRVLPAAAGLVLVLPSMFGSFGMDLRLGLSRLGFTLAALAVGSIFATESERTSAVTAWIGDGARRLRNQGGLTRPSDCGSCWAIGSTILRFGSSGRARSPECWRCSCPYQAGFDLFSRTAWLGALLGALIGTALKRGTGMDLPIASLLVLKGGGLGPRLRYCWLPRRCRSDCGVTGRVAGLSAWRSWPRAREQECGSAQSFSESGCACRDGSLFGRGVAVTQMTGGQAILASIAQGGVDTIFGIPGVQHCRDLRRAAGHPELRHVIAVMNRARGSWPMDMRGYPVGSPVRSP